MLGFNYRFNFAKFYFDYVANEPLLSPNVSICICLQPTSHVKFRGMQHLITMLHLPSSHYSSPPPNFSINFTIKILVTPSVNHLLCPYSLFSACFLFRFVIVCMLLLVLMVVVLTLIKIIIIIVMFISNLFSPRNAALLI